METMVEVQGLLDGVPVVCPECGKKPSKCACVDLKNGFARKDMACCHGTGSVTVHLATGRIVDTTYRNAVKTDAVAPAYIPLVFAAGAGKGASVRVTGWLREPLPVDKTASCGTVASSDGFWTRVKHCLSRLWH